MSSNIRRINLDDERKWALWQWLKSRVDWLEKEEYTAVAAAQLASNELGFSVTVAHLDASTKMGVVRRWYGREYLAPGQSEELREQIEQMAERLGQLETKAREARSLTGGVQPAELAPLRELVMAIKENVLRLEELRKEDRRVIVNTLDRVREGEERLKKLEAWRDRVAATADDRAKALEEDLLAVMEEVEALKRRDQPAHQEEPVAEPTPADGPATEPAARPLSVAEQLAAIPLPEVKVEPKAVPAPSYDEYVDSLPVAPGAALQDMPADVPPGAQARTTDGLALTADGEAKLLEKARELVAKMRDNQRRALVLDSIRSSEYLTDANAVSWEAKGFRCRLGIVEDAWHTAWAVEVQSRRYKSRNTGGHRDKQLAKQAEQICGRLLNGVGCRPAHFHPSKGGTVCTMVATLTNAERDARTRLRAEGKKSHERRA